MVAILIPNAYIYTKINTTLQTNKSILLKTTRKNTEVSHKCMLCVQSKNEH